MGSTRELQGISTLGQKQFHPASSFTRPLRQTKKKIEGSERSNTKNAESGQGHHGLAEQGTRELPSPGALTHKGFGGAHLNKQTALQLRRTSHGAVYGGGGGGFLTLRLKLKTGHL